MFQDFIRKIAAATPKHNAINWMLYSVAYALVLLINEHFEVLRNFGIVQRNENIIKFIGAYGYILITTYHFHKQDPQDPNPTNVLPTENTEQPDHMDSNVIPTGDATGSGLTQPETGNKANGL